MMNGTPMISVIIPTLNGSERIGRCLNSLKNQAARCNSEVIVVDDGSIDSTAEMIRDKHPWVRLISQKNLGPAAARNRGAREAVGDILVFTDDDCETAAGWLDAMLRPFSDPEVVGTKGVYRTCQQELMAKFVQAEYEDKYRIMARYSNIDFIDAYSAAFRRDKFLEINGYDTEFPVACAEDVDLSYRMSARGWIMKFVPEAIVYHQHPNSFLRYVRKKFKFAFWRVLAVKKNPQKAIRDTHTPQLMKLQLLFAPLLFACGTLDLVFRPEIPMSILCIGAFLLTCLPFTFRAMRKDLVVGFVAPVVLTARSFAQFLGIAFGIMGVKQKSF
jgi:GT2 family glycosyltransferase